MKKYNITVNGVVYEVVVEEVDAANAAVPVAPAAPAASAAPASAPALRLQRQIDRFNIYA